MDTAADALVSRTAGRRWATFGLVTLLAGVAGPAGAAVVADSVLFNAASNVVADGDEPPGLVVAILASSTQSNADDPADAFGNADGPVEPDTFIFGDSVGGSPDDGDQVLGNGDEIVDSLEWQTITPVTLAGYRLHVTQFDPFGRTTELVRFLVDGLEQDFFDNDSATGPSNAVNVIDRPFAGVVTGSTFRLELTRGSNGPRITEIDALVDASEDPRININIAGGGTNPMAPAELAGAPDVRDDNWVNLAGTNQEAGPIQVLGGDGLPVPGALASWTGFGQGDFLEDGSGTDDGHMFSSLFDARSYPAIDVTVTGVPYPLYDVYAYHQGGASAGLFRVARFSIGDTDLFSLRREDFAYVESTSTTDLGSLTEPGSYVVFHGLADPAFTLTVGGGSASDGFQRARFAGLQIVEATTSTSTTTSTSSSSTTTTSSSSSTVPSSVTTTTSTSSSTSSTAPSTTTSTLPAGTAFPPGRKLLVKRKKSGAQRLQLLVKSPEITVDAGADPPCRIDGELVIEAVGAGAPAARFPLDAGLWRPIKTAKPEKGCKYRKGPVVATVLLKAGKMLEIVANAPDLGVPLAADPRPVRIALRHGDVLHCFEFGGAKGQHRPDKKLLARNAERATTCPVQGSPSGAFVGRRSPERHETDGPPRR